MAAKNNTYTIYFRIGSKKMKMEIEAPSEAVALATLKKMLVIDKVVAPHTQTNSDNIVDFFNQHIFKSK